MAVVSYNESAIVPAPLYNLSENIRRTGDGTPISVEYNITLTGSIVACKGSPNSAGSYSTSNSAESCSDADAKFKNITTKQNLLRTLFKDDGLKLEITDDDGTVLISCYPRVNSITFSPEVNVEKNNYSINLVAHELVGVGAEGDGYPDSIVSGLRYNLDTLSESVDIAEQLERNDAGNEESFFNITNTVSARGAKTYDNTTATLPGPWNIGDEDYNSNPGFYNARAAVQKLMTETFSSGDHLYSMVSSAEYFLTVSDLGDYIVVNDSTAENGDFFEGTYGATRTFQLRKKFGSGSNAATHDYTVESVKGRPKGDNFHGYENVYTINGTIVGFSKPNSSPYKAAEQFFADYIADDSGFDKVMALIKGAVSPNPNLNANAIPVTKSYSANKKSGTISYSYSFKENVNKDNSNDGTFFADYSLKVSDTHDNNKVAIIPILGRAAGPIIQDLNTTDVLKRTISGTFILKNNKNSMNSGNPYQANDINAIRIAAVNVMEAQPAGLFGGTDDTYYVENWTDGLDIFSGTYDVSMTLIYKRGDSDAVSAPTSSGWWLPDMKS